MWSCILVGLGTAGLQCWGGGGEFGCDRAGDRGKDRVEFKRSSDMSEGRSGAGLGVSSFPPARK